MSRWIRLLRRIQAGGKLLVVSCEPCGRVRPTEVETLLSELGGRVRPKPEGLWISTQCASESDARELLRNAARWSAHRQWVVVGRTRPP